MTEYTCDSFRFFNLFPVYFGGKGTDKAMMTPSNYIRAAALRKKLQVILDGKAVAKELNAIGNNLNQLTTLAHMGRVQVANLDAVHRDLDRLYHRFFELAEQESR